MNLKPLVKFTLTLAILLSACLPTTQLLAATPETAQPSAMVPPPPQLDAKGFVLMDANSGKVIAAKNPNKKLPPASLTKLMTLYLTEQALANNEIHLNDKVRISKLAWKTGGSRMFVKVNSEVPVKKLIEGIIVASGNDATMALAQYVGGNIPSFVQMMNAKAKQLGMKNTHYSDPTGLPIKNHYSTPYDLSLLTRAVVNDFPQYYHFYKQKWITYNKIRQPNRNRLLWRDSTVDGLKTGHTDSAGYCLITSAKRQGMRLISVVMGTPTDSARANESQALLNYGFRFYTTRKLFTANKPIKKQRIWLGKNKYTTMGVSSDVYVTLPKSVANKIKVTLTLNKTNVEAPIKKGQQYGVLTISADKTIIKKVPLVALQKDQRASFLTRMKDHVGLTLHKWF